MKIKKLLKARLIIFLFLAIITLAAGFAFAYFMFSEKPESNDIVLLKESGKIFYKATESEEYKEMAELEVNLQTGAYIKTDEDSYARVYLPDNSLISIDQKTEIKVDYSKSKVDVNQFIGKTWHRVESVTKGGEYKVQTPNALAAVRGTTFGVDVESKDLSRIFVEESKVVVQRIDTPENDRKVLEEITLEAGEMATIIRDSKSFRIEKGKLSDDYKNSFWFKRNKLLDQEYSKFKDSKKRGSEFRDELRKDVLKLDNAEDSRLGLLPASELSDKDLKSKLDDVENITKITESTCITYSQNDIQLAIDKVFAYKDYIENYQDINDLLENLKKGCADGKFDLVEEDLLRNQVEEINK